MTLPAGSAAVIADSGLKALRQGDALQAQRLLKEALAAGADAGLAYNLALASDILEDDAGVLAALDILLPAQPRHWAGLLLKGRALERSSGEVAASDPYNAALACAPPFERVPLEHKPWVRRALEVRTRVQQDLEDFTRKRLSNALGQSPAADLGRVGQSLDVYFGHRQVYFPNPLDFFMVGLPVVQFYDRELFDWLPELESQTAAIRDEFLALIGSEAGAEPYVQYPSHAPVDQWVELNHNPRWTAYHLKVKGKPEEINADRCPKTIAALEKTDYADIDGRSPVAMYSVLRPKTRIPPHTGDINARLLCHLPLIIPEGCGFRVGNETRSWVPGTGWVFDDTINHEAWNDSEHLRTIVIFDVWNPYVKPHERLMINEIMRSRDAFYGHNQKPWTA